MRIPIRINRKSWPRWIAYFVPSSKDPRELFLGTPSDKEFTELTSIFRFGKTFKTTAAKRYPQTLQAIKEYPFSNPPIALDIGASDGMNSLQLLDTMHIERLFLSDLHLEAFYCTQKSKTYFFDSDSNWILTATPYFISFPPTQNSFIFFRYLCNTCFKPMNVCRKTDKVSLINPLVLTHSQKHKIKVVCHNVFNEWEEQKLDLVIVANVLNKSYFSDAQISQAVRKLTKALNNNGLIVFIDNRKVEQSSTFRSNGGVLQLEQTLNGGSEITQIVIDTLGTNTL